MDAPTCRLCHTKHWPREGCKFVSTAACPSCAMWKAERERLLAANATLTAQLVSAPQANTKVVLARPANRNEYQREYMRARRAKAAHAK